MTINLAPTISDYYLDDNLVTLIIGAVGSGKTLGSIVKLERLMYEQEPSSDGISYTRWAVIRNTYLELKDTTIKSFQGFFGDLLQFNWGNMTAVYNHNGIHAEFLFRSLDKPEDMRKLLSLEITGAYLNEMRELPKEALENIISRLGRYPSAKDGVGCTKSNVLADSNAFPDDHWIYELFLTDKRPKDYSVYIQPPAILDDNTLNPAAENLENLPKDYYTRQLAGATENFVDIMLKVKFIAKKDGKAVYPEFNQKIHVVDHTLLGDPNKALPLICSSDNGRWSGWLLGQVDTFGRIVVFDEILSDDINLTEFSRIIKTHIQQHYSSFKFATWIDPWAANQRGQLSDMTMFKAYNNADLHPRISNTRSPDTMVEAVKKKLGSITIGQPDIIISTKCKNLIRGLNGGYMYKRINVSGDRYAEKPDKGKFSHICNAFEFMVDGSGASREMLASNKHTEVVQIKSDWDAI